MLPRVMPGAETPRQHSESNEVEVRLSELEIRSEFQSKTMDDLDAVVREFAERVDRLERELKELRQQLESLSGDEDVEGVVD